MGKVVLDTSVWIHMERTGELSHLLEPDDELIMAAAALAELKSALWVSGRSSKALEATQGAIQSFLDRSMFAPIEQRTAEIFAELKIYANASGKPRGVNDLWIAASARQLNATVVTMDTAAVFEDLPGVIVRF
jgi:predicted nucleic acid-binding protein